MGASEGTEGKHLRLSETAAAHLDSLNGVRTTQKICAPALHTLDRDARPPECTGLGARKAWGLDSNPRARTAVGHGEKVHGGGCFWRNAGQPWRQGAASESCAGSETITVLLSLQTPALAADQ